MESAVNFINEKPQVVVAYLLVLTLVSIKSYFNWEISHSGIAMVYALQPLTIALVGFILFVYKKSEL